MTEAKPPAEVERLRSDAVRKTYWKHWGPYLSERQWGTVREDYSEGGDSWTYFPHDHARSRAYRWGEDGLLGISDTKARLCFGLALWNGADPILKERLFGLTGPEGNHGEDVKELYFYLDATPTSSYLKGLYKYPHAAFPYQELLNTNARRGYHEREYELVDTGVFNEGRYFDVFAEYAKAAEDDILIRISVHNRGPQAQHLHVLPTLWFRNTWSWGRSGEGYGEKPVMKFHRDHVVASHRELGEYELFSADQGLQGALFTENETNNRLLFGAENASPYTKDAFHRYVIDGELDAVNPKQIGTKASYHLRADVQPNTPWTIDLRLRKRSSGTRVFGSGFDRAFNQRRADADDFYRDALEQIPSDDERSVSRQAAAGLLWSKQFYYYVVSEWQEGDPSQPKPPANRVHVRNHDWEHLYNRDVISMPDKWEYPWYAAWDLAFHMIPFARLDPQFSKEQLLLFLREWYMHPSGIIPAYEFKLDDVNPPVHAWAAWRVYKITAPREARDYTFLARVFQKLLLNFTWWVNRKDPEGNNLFSGGFLGLDNIGIFDRSKPLPTGGHLAQADGTAWMAFYCTTMLAIAMELAEVDPAAEDMASKFFEHFVAISDAINGDQGLWDEEDGFYYDALVRDGHRTPLRVRSMVGLIPLFATQVLDQDLLDRLPGFKKRMNWLLENRPELSARVTEAGCRRDGHRRLLAIPSPEQLTRILRYVLDEREFLSPYGIRSLSRIHLDQPYVFSEDGHHVEVRYVSGESDSGLFGGNSNWRGPVWMPVNYLLIEALERYHHFYGDDFKVECPTGSGQMMTLAEVADEIGHRLARLFLQGKDGRPCHGGCDLFRDDPHFRDLPLFYEYFDGDTGRGLGASHQTGWTALVASLIFKMAHRERWVNAHG